MRWIAMLGLLAAGCSGPAAPPDPAPSYVVAFLTGAGAQPFATPLGMNELGEIAGYFGEDAWHPASRPVLVEADGTPRILPGPDGFAYALDAAGTVVGEVARQACAWVDGDVHLLAVKPGFFSGAAHAINENGVIVGSFGDHDQAGPHHCFWASRDDEAVLLRGFDDGSPLGSAWAVNAAGQIAGTSGGFEGTFFAARWDDAGALPLRIGPLPGAVNSDGLGLNGKGDVVGRSSFPDFTSRAFVYVDATGTLSALPDLPGAGGFSEAWDLNDDGDVVGTSRAADGRPHAVLWRGGRAHDLNGMVVLPPGVRRLASAHAIDNAGRIAAQAELTNGQHRVVLLIPVP